MAIVDQGESGRQQIPAEYADFIENVEDRIVIDPAAGRLFGAGFGFVWAAAAKLARKEDRREFTEQVEAAAIDGGVDWDSALDDLLNGT
ncbi:MAG: hypothetical protein LBM73_01040 [Candidatus Nomurabacteria bacterium]|jgi:hypothetical protein|nr:hypothetical protein [Candidatus Nomurabacteria bacterium]